MAPSSAQRRRGWRDWANLDAGPAGLIAEHVLRNDLVDLIRFRAACRPWRACSAHLRAQGVLDRRFLPRSWIMLPRKFNKVDDRRRFLNVSTGESIYRSLTVPDPWSNYLLGTTHEGLVLLLSNGVSQLLNPLTGQLTGLPSAATLVDIAACLLLWNVELRGAGLGDDDTVVLHLNSYSLVIAKPGDKRWTEIDSRVWITSVLPLAGCVYCATSRNISLVQTTTMANQPPKLVEGARHELHKEVGAVLYVGQSWVFLVENNGGLVLCHRACPESRTDEKYSVSVHLVNLTAKNTVPLRGLSGKALFLGKRRSVLVATRVSPSINADTAYLCWPRPKDVLVYAVDLLGGGCVEAKFEEVDAAYYLPCYVSDYSSE
uniref:KIB1-4 beta-propeller domain-containing protein n=1 Tax=Aegilops tauschii TaxID=37682 RepID=N1QXC0_AEGTA